MASPGGFDAFFLGLKDGYAQGYQSGFPGNDYLRFLGERERWGAWRWKGTRRA